MYTANTRTTRSAGRAAWTGPGRLEAMAWKIDRMPDGLRAIVLGALGGAGILGLVVFWIVLA